MRRHRDGTCLHARIIRRQADGCLGRPLRPVHAELRGDPAAPTLWCATLNAMGEYIIPADEQRFDEEIAGTERAPRPASLAGDYLMEAIERLHDAGDPRYLYQHWRRFPGQRS